MFVYITSAIFILFDIVTGVTKALYTDGLNSTILRQGLFHKLSELIAIFGSGLLGYGTKYVGFNIELPLLGVVSSYICLMEFVSILENLSVVNPDLARLFKPYLEKLKSKDGDNDERKS